MSDENGMMESLRHHAKAERELKIENWVFISIEYKDASGNYVKLYKYDLPRELAERYRWVIRWRTAKCQCQHPRHCVNTYYSYYDKRTGLPMGWKDDLSALVAAKAQITKAENREQEYLTAMRNSGNLFWNESTDEQLKVFRAKLQTKRDKYACLLTKIEAKVEQAKREEPRRIHHAGGE